MSDSAASLAPVVPVVSRALMPRGLWVLILLRYKATLRRMAFGSPKRRLFTFLGLGVMAIGILPSLLAARKPPFSPEGVRLWLPLILVGFVVLQLFVRSRRDPLTFSPAEIDLVVPGPFSRRQLVLYQVLYQVGPLIVMGLWMGLFIRAGGSYLATAIGAPLLLFAVNLLAGIILSSMGILRGVSRLLVPGILGGVVVAMVWAVLAAPARPQTTEMADWIAWAVEIRHTPLVEALCLPTRPYAEILAAASVVDALPWVLVAVVMNAVLVVAFVMLDRGEVEALVSHSQRELAKVEKAKSAGARVKDPEKAAKLRVRMLPRLGGAGPLVWRRVTMLYRSIGPVGLSVAVVGIVSAAFLLGWWVPEAGLVPVMLIFGGAGSFFLSLSLREDFRSELDHMAMFKTLPIPPMTIVAGQLATPVLAIVALQCLAAFGVACGAMSPRIVLYGVLIALATVPLSVMLVAIENTIFLFTPTRPLTSSMQSGFDPSAMGRTMLVTMTKLLTVAGAVAVVGGPAAGVWYLAGIVPAVLVGLVAMGALLTGLVFACAKAFVMFNVADDEPG